MDPQEYYNQHAITYFENTVDLDVSHLIKPFAEHLDEGAAVLDLGCGSGRDCLTFLDMGFDVTALDGSSEMCSLAEIHTDLDILHMNFEELDFEDVFDGIWALASLIHINKYNLPAILQKISDALTDNGIFFMSLLKGYDGEIRDEQYFAKYTEEEIESILTLLPDLKLVRFWETDEVRGDGVERSWLNVLLQKK